MTKRDFIQIAEALARSQPKHLKSDPNDTREACEVWAGVVDALADSLQNVNPRFDADRFRTACLRRPE